MFDFKAGVVAEFFGGFDHGFRSSGAVAFGDEAGQFRIRFRKLERQRMVGRKRDEGRAEQSIGAV